MQEEEKEKEQRVWEIHRGKNETLDVPEVPRRSGRKTNPQKSEMAAEVLNDTCPHRFYGVLSFLPRTSSFCYRLR